MVSPTLHLFVEKGPKQGETLAHNPGAVVRIGRVIRGNTFAIKDPGISQKHLTIEFTSEISRWTVKDLDTSNGTVINDTKIPSSTPFLLSDGDTIKIGETTSFSVKIDGGGENEDELRPEKRRIGARFRAESLASVVEDENFEEVERNGEDRVEKLKKLKRGRPRRGNSSRILKKDEILGEIVEDSVGVIPRRAGVRTRGAAARVLKEEGPSDNNVEADSMRVSKENELLDSVVDSIDAPKNVKRGRPKKAPARTRPTRTRSSTANLLQADEFLQSDSLAEEFSKKGEPNVEDIVADEGKEVGSAEERDKRVDEETIIDFEKMTLGEWFDSMGKYLPQSINEVAEQMIANLREKARCFDEFIVNGSRDG